MRIKFRIMEKITNVWFTPDRVYIRTDADNIHSCPLGMFPILKEASSAQRDEYSIELDGEAIRWPSIDEDIHISSFLEAPAREGDNEVSEMFTRFPWLNVSEIARAMGINKSLLARYIYGIKKPSADRVRQIRSTIREMGRAMSAL